ncbi:MAG: hypothetical protein FIA99_19010 [Ruminiclostridium sp.]|nr:hypothetical protein [Ruminiclostridium sp.]
MKYLESAVKFLLKYWILAVPLFVLTAVASLVSGVGLAAAQFSQLWTTFGNPAQLTDPGSLIKTIPLVLPAIVGGGILAFIFNFIAIPATYGLVNKGLESGNAGLNDIGSAVSQNFVKYVMYFIGTLVLGIAAIIALLIVTLLLGLILSLLGGFGAVLLTIIMLAIFIAVIVFLVLLSMWLSAMVVDNLDVVAAAKKSIEVVKTSFWTVLGITILVAIVCAIVGFILNLLVIIPLLGPIIASIVPTVQTFVMIVFLLMLYREKTGKTNAL